MNLKQRDKKIKELRLRKKDGKHEFTLEQLAVKFNLTRERVRQICLDKESKEHVLSEIKYKYRNKFKHKLSLCDLLKDIAELSKPDRRKEIVIRRKILVDFLVDELGLPFTQVGILLNRDHTSIMNLYYGDK